MDTPVGHRVATHAAVVWIDLWHALVAQRDHGRATVHMVERRAQPIADYLVEVAREAADCDRLMILGPDGVAPAFGSAYGALYHRTGRFLDVEAAPPATDRELLERLRLLDPDERLH